MSFLQVSFSNNTHLVSNQVKEEKLLAILKYIRLQIKTVGMVINRGYLLRYRMKEHNQINLIMEVKIILYQNCRRLERD